MNRIWVNKAGSFEEADKFEAEYYEGLTRQKRVETVQLLREEYFKSKGLELGGNGKRLRRVLSVIKQVQHPLSTSRLEAPPTESLSNATRTL